jgi:hypothetical protein
LPSPILARADALMHRRRQHDSEPDEIPVLTDAIDADDIPVLLDAEAWPTIEEVAMDEAALADAPLAASEECVVAPLDTPAPRLDPALRDHLIHELARRVEQRLSAELPRIIESTVLGFLAEQEMIARQTAQD